MSKERPRIGIGVFVCRGDKILLGLRKGAHGAGEWALPGGGLEQWESPEACAVREVEEETGLVISDLVRGPYTNDLFPADGLHYVTLFYSGVSPAGTPVVVETTKCEGWGWFTLDQLPSPRFAGIDQALALGFDPFARAAEALQTGAPADSSLPAWQAGAPATGQLFRHRKGGLYRVLARAYVESSLAQAIVYAKDGEQHAWVRPLADFVQRFAPVE
jgi:8-oxo-dGTP diphosphatase